MIHAVLPGDIDDPATPSGGNTYDRRLLTGLAARGWAVREHGVPGTWPTPSPADRARLARVLAQLPGDAVVLVDGLVGSAVPELLRPLTRVVVLVHQPLGDAAERATLAGAAAVVVTSGWTRSRLPGPADVARPGVDPARPAPGTAAGSRLLCVAAVTRGKGHDLLLAALATIPDLAWDCACVGPLTRDPDFAAGLRPGRVRFRGPLVGADLDAAYAGADLLVLPSRAETYGMVVTEALARGIPVLAAAVGGVPEALGRAPDGSRPGLLVPPGDPVALAAALRRWLTDAGLRERLRAAARARRDTLTGWAETARLVSDVLARVSAEPGSAVRP